MRAFVATPFARCRQQSAAAAAAVAAAAAHYYSSMCMTSLHPAAAAAAAAAAAVRGACVCLLVPAQGARLRHAGTHERRQAGFQRHETEDRRHTHAYVSSAART